ncbi:NAD-dependent epimerase/dehydratase family protein [Chloroflexota bacterium]
MFQDEFKGKKVLITGGLGFIGSNLAYELVELGASVLIVDSLLPDGGGNIHNVDGIKEKVMLNFSDIRDSSSVRHLVRGQDYVFNLAAQLSHVDSMADPFTDLDINCRGHLNLLQACREHNRTVKIVYTGTRGQYGMIQYTPVDERHPMNPTDANGITKLAGEHYHLLYNRAYGIRTTSLRLTNVYGPRHQMRHSRQGFIGWFIRQAMDGETVQIFGDGGQLRDFNHVDDIVAALLMVATSEKADGEVFNLGSGTPISLADLVEAILRIVGKGDRKFVPYPEDRKQLEIGDYIADITKIRKVLGWGPTIQLEAGLESTVQFYKANRDQYW